jgi:hypothetical protein
MDALLAAYASSSDSEIVSEGSESTRTCRGASGGEHGPDAADAALAHAAKRARTVGDTCRCASNVVWQ